MDHSGLYKPTFPSCISDRRLKESKTTRQQRRNDCFQKSRIAIIDISSTPNIVKEDVNKFGRFVRIPLVQNIDKENLFNKNNSDNKCDEAIKVLEKKNISIKSKMERQQVFINKFSEWKKQKEITKFQQRETMKAKPFVTACFKNPVFGEPINAIKPIETKTQCDNSKFKFQMKNCVLLPPVKAAVANVLKDKKVLKSSENIYKKRLPLGKATSKTKVNNDLITNSQNNPLETFNKKLNKNVKHKICKLETRTTMHSPVIPVKNQINKAPVNKNKSIQTKINKTSRTGPNLLKNSLELKIDQKKKIRTLKRPPIFLKENRKSTKIKRINEKPTDKITFEQKIEIFKFLDTPSMPNSILETTNFDSKKSAISVFATSTLRKHAENSLPLSLDLEESVIKPYTSIKNTSLENDLRPILSSSDENTPVNKTKEKKPRDFHLSKTKKINESISESNNKATPTRRISERLSTKKKLTSSTENYLIDICSRTPVPSTAHQQTPTQLNNIEDQNYYYMSPIVTLSRGKFSARKEREIQDSMFLATLSYFRAQLKEEEARLLKLCSDWLDYLNTLNSDVISDNAGPMVNEAIGVTNLLISEKMKKFAQLIERCEETVTTNKFDNLNITDLDDSVKPVQTEDLDGFWYIIRQQIEHLEKLFNNLVKWRENDWNDPDVLQPNKTKERTKNNIIRKKKKGVKSEISGNIELRETLKSMRSERLKKRHNKRSGLNGLDEIIEVLIPSQEKGFKSSNAVEVKKPKTSNNTINNSIINMFHRNSTPCSSRKSTRKCDKITPRMEFEDYDLISFTKTPEQSLPLKSILKTPGSIKKNCNVLFHDKIAEFKSPEINTFKLHSSMGRTLGSTTCKGVATKKLLFNVE